VGRWNRLYLKISRNFLDILPISTSKAHRPIKKEVKFPGWGKTSSLTIISKNILTAFDFQTLLSVLYLSQHQSTELVQWKHSGGHIPVRIVTCSLAEFILKYRRRSLNMKREVEDSLLRLMSVTFKVEKRLPSGNTEINGFHFLWHYAIYYHLFGKYTKVEQLYGVGRRPKKLRVGFAIDADLWDECQRGFTIRIDPILDSSSPTTIILGTWIQGHRYTALDEETLRTHILHCPLFHRQFQRKYIINAFNELVERGVLREWDMIKCPDSGYRFTWKRVKGH